MTVLGGPVAEREAGAWRGRGEPRRTAALHSDDPGDDYLLALAARERTPLVSDDAHVLALSDKLPISSPRAFLEQLARS